MAFRLRDIFSPSTKQNAELPAGNPQYGPEPGGRTSAAVAYAVSWALGLPPSRVWESQPYVRTVITFLARNVAQLGLHVFQRVSDEERERLRDHPIARLFRRPSPTSTTYELLFGLVSDLALYDRAYWLPGIERDGTPRVVRIPPARVVEHVGADPLLGVDQFRILDAQGRRFDVPADRILYFPGWNPLDPLGLPTSPLESLKNVIAEQAAAFEFRKATWENGAQVQGSISRPTEAPQWTKDARDRFIEDVRSQFGPDGPRRGGWMLLEDGMSATTQQFNAREAEWIEAAKLSLSIVASVYHVNPTMVGLLDNANYSNVREFRRMLYGDTLGPTLAQVEERINAFLIPKFTDEDNVYVEFNIAEKLQGSFEEQAAAFQAAVGAPWMTRAEARSRLNLPTVPDADALVVPLNVLTGGVASPRDTAPDEPARVEASGDVSTKARPATPTEDKHAEVLRAFFKRQRRVVLSAFGAKADGGWWDAERWDRELADDLYALAVQTSKGVAAETLAKIGFEPDAYDVDQTLAFLRAMSERVSGLVNESTFASLREASRDTSPRAAMDDVFAKAEEARAPQLATTFVTATAGFATREAGKQAAGDRARKTWITTSSRPRPSHARMSGESVPVDEPFSNGAQWPGDISLSPDERAGCTCTVEITVER